MDGKFGYGPVSALLLSCSNSFCLNNSCNPGDSGDSSGCAGRPTFQHPLPLCCIPAPLSGPPAPLSGPPAPLSGPPAGPVPSLHAKQAGGETDEARCNHHHAATVAQLLPGDCTKSHIFCFPSPVYTEKKHFLIIEGNVLIFLGGLCVEIPVKIVFSAHKLITFSPVYVTY